MVCYFMEMLSMVEFVTEWELSGQVSMVEFVTEWELSGQVSMVDLNVVEARKTLVGRESTDVFCGFNALKQ